MYYIRKVQEQIKILHSTSMFSVSNTGIPGSIKGATEPLLLAVVLLVLKAYKNVASSCVHAGSL